MQVRGLPSGRWQLLREHRLTLAVALATAIGSASTVTRWLHEDEASPASLAFAQSLFAPESLHAPTSEPVAEPRSTGSSPRSDEDEQAVFLVRSTLMALNDANRSGNYSVLRDLAGPRFQARNSVLRLRETFQAFRDAGVDLSHAGMVEPNVTQRQVSATDTMLALRGVLPAPPASRTSRIGFAMEFEALDGHWRLLTLSVDVAPRP